MSLGKIIKHAHFSQKFQIKEEKTEQKKNKLFRNTLG